MPTQKDILIFLTSIKPTLQKDGIESLGLFGSYVKNNATTSSDIAIKIKTMVYKKFKIRSDVFDLDSYSSSLKNQISKEVLYV